MKKLTFPLTLLAPMFFLASCLDQKPDVIGAKKLSIYGVDNATVETFKFNFAYRDTAAAAPDNRYVYLQGISISKTAIQSTCGLAGTSCVCRFMNSSGAVIDTTTSARIAYSQDGNFLRCEFSATGTLANLAKVQVRSQSGTKESEIYTIDNSLSAREIIGDLDMNKLRTVSRYYCLLQFIHKYQTGTSSFNCNDAAAHVCAAGSEICLQQVYYPFHLYKDGISNNYNLKPVDDIYRNLGANETLCNSSLQLKRYDCTGAGSATTTRMGLYSEQVGIFQLAIQLPPGPDLTNDTYGYAAEVATIGGTQVCPPGLVKMKVWESNPSVASFNIGGQTSINLPANYKGYQVASSSAPGLSTMDFTQKYGVNDCTGVTCGTDFSTTNPTVNANAYSASTTVDEFCAFPASLL